MVSKICEQKQALQKLLPLYERQRKELEQYKKLNEHDDYMELIKQQNDELEEYAKKTKKIENYEKKLKKMAEEKEQLINELQEKIKEIEKMTRDREKQNKTYVTRTEDFERKITEQTKKIEEYEQKLKEIAKKDKEQIQIFYDQKNLDFIRNSYVIMDKMCQRLSVKDDKDYNKLEPPFKDISSMDIKKKELIGYFDLLQKNLDGSTKESEIQIKIREWMSFNYRQLLYRPTVQEIDLWKKEMEKAINLKDTIGSIGYMPIKRSGLNKYYFIFAIANGKILCWTGGVSVEGALGNLHMCLTDRLKWGSDMKFATDIYVSKDISDIFVNVCTNDVEKIPNNQKVLTWMTNNFESLKYSFKELHHQSAPAIYHLALKYFEESVQP